MKRMENLEKALRGFFVARDSDSRDESPLAPSTLPLLADSVEKVGPSRLPAYRPLKKLFLRAATRNLSSETSVESKDFNLGCILFSCGNHGRLFKQNRAISVCCELRCQETAAGHGQSVCGSNSM